MEKKWYLHPKKNELKEGAIFPIYLNYKEQKNFQGNAKLIEYKPSDHVNELPYIRHSIGEQKSKTILWSYKRWIVEFIDGPNKGFKTARYISHFLTISSIISSSDQTNLFKND